MVKMLFDYSKFNTVDEEQKEEIKPPSKPKRTRRPKMKEALRMEIYHIAGNLAFKFKNANLAGVGCDHEAPSLPLTSSLLRQPIMPPPPSGNTMIVFVLRPIKLFTNLSVSF